MINSLPQLSIIHSNPIEWLKLNPSIIAEIQRRIHSKNKYHQKKKRFFSPIQMPNQGQWWSCNAIHLPHSLQCFTLKGCSMQQTVQYLFSNTTISSFSSTSKVILVSLIILSFISSLLTRFFSVVLSFFIYGSISLCKWSSFSVLKYFLCPPTETLFIVISTLLSLDIISSIGCSINPGLRYAVWK